MDSLIANYLSQLRYVLIPGSLPLNNTDPEKRDLHEKAYVYWKQFWTQVFIDNGDRRVLNSDDFLRQDIVSLIMHRNEIIGMHLYSFFDVTLDSTKQQSYFTRSYNDIYMAFLNGKAHTAMSWEYLTVDPKWRKSQVGISFAMVLLGMAVKIQELADIDMGIAVSRSDVKVTEMCQKYGAQIIFPHINMHNTPCDLIACHKSEIQSPKDQAIKAHIYSLWEKKVNFITDNQFVEMTLNQPSRALKIAG